MCIRDRDIGEFDTVYLNIDSGNAAAQYFVDPMWSHSFRLKLGFTPYKVLNKQPSDRWFFSTLSRSKVFGFFGYTEQRERLGINSCGDAASRDDCFFGGGRANTQGFDSGIIIDTPIWKSISTRIEFSRTKYDTISAHYHEAAARTIININRDPINQLRIGLFYNF